MAQLDMSHTQQASLLTILCMDDKNSSIIRNSLPLVTFEGRYGDIARRVYVYVDKHKRAPRFNLDDLFDDILRKNDAKAREFIRIFRLIAKTWEDINPHGIPYQMSRLESTLRFASIKIATKDLVDLVQTGRADDEALERMETIIHDAAKQRVVSFDPGTVLGDKTRALEILTRDVGDDVLPTGIAEFDASFLGPKRKSLHLFLGLKKSGKTWWLCNIAKHAMMLDMKILHVSLEMSEDQLLRRYYQAMFAIAKRRPSDDNPEYRSKIFTDDYGRVEKIGQRRIRPKIALDDRRIRTELVRRIERHRRKLINLYIKEFPTRQLTMRGLVAFLDRLEAQQGFVPDLLILDYPMLMKLDTSNLRMEVGAAVADLRGIAVERNIAVATVGQLSKRAMQKAVTTSEDIGEDFSQTQTADVVMTYSQRPMEGRLGLARIMVDSGRDEKDKWGVLIAQSYTTGQFCVGSARLTTGYYDALENVVKRLGLEEED